LFDPAANHLAQTFITPGGFFGRMLKFPSECLSCGVEGCLDNNVGIDWLSIPALTAYHRSNYPPYQGADHPALQEEDAESNEVSEGGSPVSVKRYFGVEQYLSNFAARVPF
jgi:hypothetical protein